MYVVGLVTLSECISPALGVAHQALEEINPAGDNILIQGVKVACVLWFIQNVMQSRMWPHWIIWYWACKGYGSNKNVSLAITYSCTILQQHHADWWLILWKAV